MSTHRGTVMIGEHPYKVRTTIKGGTYSAVVKCGVRKMHFKGPRNGVPVAEIAAMCARNFATRMKPTSVTRTKARQILHDKKARGRPLTDAQRRFFGAASRRKNSAGSVGQTCRYCPYDAPRFVGGIPVCDAPKCTMRAVAASKGAKKNPGTARRGGVRRAAAKVRDLRIGHHLKARGLSGAGFGVSNPAPSAHVEWTKVPQNARVTLEGKPGSRYYVAHLARGRRALVIWSGHDAHLAQAYLDRLVAHSAKGPGRKKNPAASNPAPAVPAVLKQGGITVRWAVPNQQWFVLWKGEHILFKGTRAQVAAYLKGQAAATQKSLDAQKKYGGRSNPGRSAGRFVVDAGRPPRGKRWSDGSVRHVRAVFATRAKAEEWAAWCRAHTQKLAGWTPTVRIGQERRKNPLTRAESKSLLVRARGNLRTAQRGGGGDRAYLAGIAAGRAMTVQDFGDGSPGLDAGAQSLLHGSARTLMQAKGHHKIVAAMGKKGGGFKTNPAGCNRCKGAGQVKLGPRMVSCPTCRRKK